MAKPYEQLEFIVLFGLFFLRSVRVHVSKENESNRAINGGSGWIRTTDLTLIRGAL